MLKSILLVGFGGFAGCSLRYLISRFTAAQCQTLFPCGTFIVNITGSFLAGLLLGYAFTHNTGQDFRLFLVVGFCGGFTTFSSFSYEFMSLMQNGHSGLAFTYALGSLLAGFLLVFLGFWLGKS